MAFKATIEANQQTAHCYQKGLKALRSYSNKVKPQHPRNVNGSVNLETCLPEPEHGEGRWDYMVGYNEEAYFIEVHPADSKNVDEVIKKAKWLYQWLKDNPDIKAIQAENDPFRWVATNGVNISTKHQFRLAQEAGIGPPKNHRTLP